MYSENWVLRSTTEYAENIIAQTGLQKLPAATLAKVADELFQEFQNTGLDIPQPFYKKAHRWSVSETTVFISYGLRVIYLAKIPESKFSSSWFTFCLLLWFYHNVCSIRTILFKTHFIASLQFN